MRELAGVPNPKQKRKIIGGLFVDVFKAEAAKLKASGQVQGRATFLAQGTIYPDVIESAALRARRPSPSRATTTWAACRTTRPEAAGGCATCSKTRCASSAWPWACPDMVYRHPFPGPGLGVRIWAR